MLAVRDGEVRPAGSGGLKRASASEGYGQMEIQAMETPLVFSWFSQETVDRFGDRFRAMGLTPVAGFGGVGAKAFQPEGLVPGAAGGAWLGRCGLPRVGAGLVGVFCACARFGRGGVLCRLG